MPGPRSLVVQDTDLHIQAGGFWPGQTHLMQKHKTTQLPDKPNRFRLTKLLSSHHFVEEGILSACQAEQGAAAGAPEAPVDPVDPAVLEAGGCSVP